MINRNKIEKFECHATNIITLEGEISEASLSNPQCITQRSLTDDNILTLLVQQHL